MTGGSAPAAPPPEVKAPAALYQGAVAAGVGKASKSWQDTLRTQYALRRRSRGK